MDPKAVQALRRLLEDVYSLDARASRALFAPASHRVDRVRLAFEDGLDGSVAAVVNPARNAV
jgi:hypothetical protein